MNHLYYLASPYSHEDPKIIEQRYELANKVAYQLIIKGYTMIEPISMNHVKALKYDMPKDFKFWQTRDTLLISRCDGVIVAMIDGWAESKGVVAEIEFAESLELPVYYWDVEKECFADV